MRAIGNPRHIAPWVVYYPAHGITQAQLDATGMVLARFDGTLASVASFAQMAVVEVIDADTLGVVMAPATYAIPALDGVLADDTLYYPHAATDGAYTATRADLELPVFRYIRNGIVQFLTPDVAMVSLATPEPVLVRYIQFEFTDAVHHTSVGYEFMVLQLIEAYATAGGANLADTLLPEGTVTTGTVNHASYGGLENLTLQTAGTHYANGEAPPVLITFDLGAGNESVFASYAVTRAAGGGNELYYPTGWIVRAGETLETLAIYDTQVAQDFSGATQRIAHDITEVGEPATAPGGTSVRYMQWQCTDATFQSSVGYRFFVLNLMQAYTDANPANITADLLQFSTATADSPNRSGYGTPQSMITAADSLQYANSADVPTLVTFDFGAGNERILSSYAITNANDSGNAPAFPTDWNILTGNDLAAMTVVHSAVAQTFPAANTRLAFNFTS